MREFVGERVLDNRPALEGESESMAKRRRAMVSSQLMGLAFTRYIPGPPVSTATPRQIARWVGPTWTATGGRRSPPKAS